MKKSLFSLCIICFMVASCSKQSSSDLTKSIVGKYTNPSTQTEITINKVDDATVSIALKHDSSCDYDLGFSNVKMNTENSFTLNEVKFTKFCDKTITGTGTYTNNNISIFAVVVSDNLGLTCCFNTTENLTISASK